ncbi:MAG: endonuclease/exonuclease/phosphatase family protein [Bacteroidales bacterium]|nr:endonuclease/exonuclease/phosphatase family protein [Bacteroidales bacterium]
MLVLLCPCAEAQVVFWNLENYFDAKDDPLTEDEEFTPRGTYHHTYRRYQAKRNLIAKGIIAIAHQCGGVLPALIGFAEVENRAVLEDLLQNTPLAKGDYSVVHQDSPDPRGIDVALLYDRERFSVISREFIRIEDFSTRDILHVRGVVKESADTMDVFVNHWPSKRSGASSSDSRRETVAAVLKEAVLKLASTERILIMGDFNDTSGSDVLVRFCSETGLKNIAASVENRDSGSLKYQGKWELIDQFIVSPALEAEIEECSVFRADFLLEADTSYLGVKPFRTYIGPRYNGGASDHLPILLRSKLRW